MRKIILAAVAGSALLALTACGDDGNDGTDVRTEAGAGSAAAGGRLSGAGVADRAGDAPNGVGAKTGGEVLTATAAALREAGSVRAVAASASGASDATSFDFRLEGDDAVGTMTERGSTFEVLRIDGVVYLRTADPASVPGLENAAPNQWATAAGFDFDNLSVDGIAHDLEGKATAVAAVVEQTTEGGRPVVVVTSVKGDRYVVASTGAPLPLSETHTDSGVITITYSEYGEDFDIVAPTDFVKL